MAGFSAPLMMDATCNDPERHATALDTLRQKSRIDFGAVSTIRGHLA